MLGLLASVMLAGSSVASFAAAEGGFRAGPSVVDSRGRVSVGQNGFSVETVALGREGALACVGGRAALSGGSVRIDRGAAIEWLVPKVGGVEQSWSFPRAPPGEGDLVIRLEVAGARGRVAPDGAMRFGDVRYGLATWIDARGRRSTLAPILEGEELVLRVPSGIIDGAAYPAVLDPLISGELETDAPHFGPGTYYHLWPKVAFGGGLFLAVWKHYSPHEQSVVGARLRFDGTVLDVPARRLSPAGHSAGMPDVAYDGEKFLVAWTEGAPGDVFVTEVALDGTVGVPVRVSTSGLAQEARPAIATVPGRALVVWTETASPTAVVYGKLLETTPSLAALEPAMLLSGTSQYAAGPRIAAYPSANEFRVIWHGREQTTAALFSTAVRTDGTTTGATVFSTSTVEVSSPDIAWSGSEFLVVWGELLDVHGLLLSASFQPLTGRIFIGADPSFAEMHPAVTYSGQQFVVAFSDNSGGNGDVALATVEPGKPTARFFWTRDSSPQHKPAVACDPAQGCVTAFEDGRRGGGDAEVYAARFNFAGEILDQPAGFLLSSSANQQKLPGIAFDGAEFLVTWQDDRAQSLDIWATRLAPGGRPGAVFRVSDAAGSTRPAGVACASRECLVVNGGLKGVLLAADGGVSSELIVAAPANYLTGGPFVAARDPGYLVAWCESGPAGATLHAVTVGPGGPGVSLVIPTTGSPQGPSLAPGDGGVLVSWAEDSRGVYGRWVLPDGLGQQLTFATAQAARLTALASNGSGFLLAYVDSDDVRAVRLGPDGVPVESPGLLELAPGVSGLSAAFDGRTYLVSWDALGPSGLALEGIEVNPHGEPVTQPPQALAPGVLPGHATAAGAGRVLLGYGRYLDQGYRTERVGLRWVGGALDGEPCTEASECASGECVDGRCGPADGGWPGLVRLEASTEPADTAHFGERLLLRASLTSDQDIPEAYLRVQPDGLRLEGGAVEARLGPIALRPGEPVQLELWGVVARQGRAGAVLEVVSDQGPLGEGPVSVDVEVIPLSTRLGCGCGSGAGPFPLGLALLVAAARSRRKH